MKFYFIFNYFDVISKISIQKVAFRKNFFKG